MQPNQQRQSLFRGDRLDALDNSHITNDSVYKRLKRALDLAVSITILILGLPILLITALLVRLKLGSPVLFTQDRPGLHGKTFRIYKFRTMTEGRDAAGCLLPDEIRLTRFGKTLRALSLDELPQLFNVALGQMSLVGPRPLLHRYVPRYSEEQKRRMLVLPGITGWAQVNGRNAVDWNKRLAMDVWYVDHASFWLDLKILAMTAQKVFFREGISANGHATMTEFMGSTKGDSHA